MSRPRMTWIRAQPTARSAVGKTTRAVVDCRPVPGRRELQRSEGWCACGGVCPRCAMRATPQFKRTVRTPADPYEQEAENVATHPLGIPQPVPRRAEPVRIMRQTIGASAATSAASDKEEMAAAETIRHATLLLALYHLSSVEHAGTPGMDHATLLKTFPDQLAAIRQWLNITPADSDFLQTIRKAQGLIWKNIKINTFKVRAANKAYPLCKTNWGFSLGNPSLGIYLCDTLFNEKSRQCRAEALTHEYFHLVGIVHGEDKKNKVPPVGATFPTDQALNSAHHMTELAFQLAGGVENTLGCEM
jgi:hypothetical protein